MFILSLALGTSGGAVCLLLWAADQSSVTLIVFGLLAVGVAAAMSYGSVLLCGRSDGAAMHRAAQRQVRVPAAVPRRRPARGHRPRAQHMIAGRR